MTPILLVDELIKFIKPVVAEFVLDSNVPGVKKAPQVIGGFLREKVPTARQEDPDFPFVIVRFLESRDDENESIATVRIIAGTYSEDTQNGWRDALNVLTRVRNALLEKQTIGPFLVRLPVTMELLEEQPFPEWVATMTLQVTIPQPQIERRDVIDGFF